MKVEPDHDTVEWAVERVVWVGLGVGSDAFLLERMEGCFVNEAEIAFVEVTINAFDAVRTNRLVSIAQHDPDSSMLR